MKASHRALVWAICRHCSRINLSNMNSVISDIEVLVAELRARRPCCIGVDGVDGAGKSSISAAIASELDIPVIGLDDYVKKKQGGYVAYIDYVALAARIMNAENYLVEGVCLLDVLKSLGVDVDCLIYVKRMSSGFWADEDVCEFPLGIEEAIRKSRQDTELILKFKADQEGRLYTPGVADEPSLREEIMRYHAQYSPHLVADITFCRSAG